jgi:hypothetical protein
MPACETRAILTITDYDVRSLYFDLLRRNLTRYGMHERMPSGWPLRRVLLKAANLVLERTNARRFANTTPRDSGGFCVVDDYLAVKACEQAVADYRAKHGISAEIVDIDGTGVLWRKQ